METRGNRKRRWKSSPTKSARAGLKFGETTPSPSPKKQRRETSKKKSTKSRSNQYEENDSFTIKSFYGKREKIRFPHSPCRRKAVNKLLDKISDENTDSDSDQTTLKTATHTHNKKSSQENPKSQTCFDFHSSDSTDMETDGDQRAVLKHSNQQNKKTVEKVPLNIIRVKKTPKRNNGITQKVYANSTGKIPIKSSLVRIENDQRTPSSTGKKFFKSRSPKSADKCFGSVVIKKGFDLKFVARRLSVGSSTPRSEKKTKVATKKVIARTKPVAVVKLSNTKPIDKDGVFYVDGESLELTDGNQNENRNDEKLDKIDSHIAVPAVEISAVVIDNDDSAIDTANSDDLFSSLPSSRNIVKTDHVNDRSDFDGKVSDDGGESEITSDVCEGTVNSEDLFSVSGRTTPVANTPSTSHSGSPLSKAGSRTDSSMVSSPVTLAAGKKLFPIFTSSQNKSPTNSTQLRKLRSSDSPCGSPLLKYVKSKDNLEQMIIDAGQKKFGVSQCDVCGMVYTLADPSDETMHHKFHQSLLSALKFTGWKKERVVQQYPDTGSRVIMVSADDPKYATNKIEEVNKIMGQELGFPEPSLRFRWPYKAFLYVSDEKKIEGCCITEPVTEGYHVIPETQGSIAKSGQRPWCCSDTPVKASLGISRIWVYNQARKKGIATKLLDCARHWSAYGTDIPKTSTAFSDPTPDGKLLATSYTGTVSFLVYKFQ